MRPLKRRPVNKRRSAGQFRKKSGRTHPANMKSPVSRGGIRF